MKLDDYISTLPYTVAALWLSAFIGLLLDGRISLTPEDLISYGSIILLIYFVLLPFKRR